MTPSAAGATPDGAWPLPARGVLMVPCPRSRGSVLRWPSRGSARPQRACGPRRSTPRSRCRPRPCATTARPTRWPRCSRCSTTSSARPPGTATPSWPSPTRPGSSCGCAGRRASCAGRRPSDSSRAATGTSGWPAPTLPGLALALDTSAQVIGAEHFRHSVHRWSCAATPIHDPATQSLLGVLDITGGADVVVPQTTALVRAAARLAESELAREGAGPARAGSRAVDRPPEGRPGVARAVALPDDGPRRARPGAHAQPQSPAQRDPAAAGVRAARAVRGRARACCSTRRTAPPPPCGPR